MTAVWIVLGLLVLPTVVWVVAVEVCTAVFK